MNLPYRKRLATEAQREAERARVYLEKHHPDRIWVEIMRTLRVLLVQCAAELTKDVDAFADEWAKDDHPHAETSRAPTDGAHQIPW